MTTKDDEAKVVDALRAIYDLRGKTLTEGAMRIWWGALRAYDADRVLGALGQVSATARYLPQPVDVLDLLDPDEWPTGPEAWAIHPKTEEESGAVCDESLGAWALAEALYEGGDVVGARRAFESAWDRLSGVSRAGGKRRPRWGFSLGWRADLRQVAAQQALSKGLLTHEQVGRYVETEEEGGRKLLGRSYDGQARGNVRALRGILGGSDGG